MRRLADTPGRVLGVYRHGRIIPTDRRAKAEWVVPPGAGWRRGRGRDRARRTAASPPPGPEAGPHHRAARRDGRCAIRQPDRHPHPRHPAGISAPPRWTRPRPRRATPLGRRTDLRDIPLVTIDGEDARDFDDAVFAEPDGSRASASIVAIADVAHYVRPGSPLDHAARTRGNSVYFPTASCRCCPRRCPTAGAACARTRTAAACSSNSTSTRTAARPPIASAAA